MADYGDPVKFPRTVFGSLQNVTLMQPFQNGCIISPKECKAGQKKKNYFEGAAVAVRLEAKPNKMLWVIGFKSLCWQALDFI